MRARLFNPWRSLSRSLVVMATLVMLCLGGVDVHTGHGTESGVAHEGVTHHDGVVATDCQPGQSPHIEAGALTPRGHCPACLHQLQTSGSEAANRWSATALQGLLVSAHDRAEKAADRRHTPASPRGPPLI